ncbi:MAG: ATP-dependent RecD-like DNA helicase [Clostridia bacterium]|nr:ATP-dependent RecD-like DNA helicase [Clostridia bacterium]
MKIKGTVESIIFQNVENWYTVVELDCNGVYETASGVFPPVTEGEEVELTGEFVETKYGRQFKAEDVRTTLPESEVGIVRYLASGLFRGVGPITAGKIVEKFGRSTLKIIENSPERLVEVSGISKEKAKVVSASHDEIKVMGEMLVGLQNLDISIALSIKIYKCYGNSSVEIVKTNPYKLVEDVDGIGFLTADRIALSENIARDSEYRIMAGIMHVLKEKSSKEGHTCLPLDLLVQESKELLGVEEEMIFSAIESMAMERKIVRPKKRGQDFVAFAQLYNLEKSSATKLIKLKNEFTPLHLSVDEDIAEYERVNGIVLNQDQKDAVKTAVTSGVMVITGGPGTGKTTIIRCIITILKKLKVKVALCAPTGRAAKRMSEACGAEAKTIHRLLGLNFTSGSAGFQCDENNPIPADVIIVDEMSMTDVYVFNALVKGIRRGGRLIMVGDRDQLASVGAGNVLHDIIGSELFPVISLNLIYRQGENSLIIENAHAINAGKMPQLDVKDKDFFFLNRSTQEEIANTVREMVLTRLPKYRKVTPKDIQVLCPMKKGLAGVNNLNEILQSVINPKQKGDAEVVYGSTMFRVGDRVMQTTNNYQMEWTKIEDDGRAYGGTGVFNGDIGTIREIDRSSNRLAVLFDDGRLAWYSSVDIGELTLSYAISIHKSQGSEFDTAVITVVGGSPQMMTKNLIYTAITRAKGLVVVIGDKRSLYRMIKNTYTAVRYSMLKELLHSEKKKYEQLYG